MKAKYIKSGLFFAAVALLFTACDTDRDDNPIIDTDHMTTQFVLNTPAYATQLVDLASSSTVNFSWSQPGYGFTVPASYSFQLSLDGTFNDAVLDEEGNETTPATYSDLAGSFTSVTGGVKASEVNRAIMSLAGWESEDDVPAAMQVYMRCKATLPALTVPSVYSNVVTINVVPSFNVAPTYAEFIYMMGNFNGWTDPVAMRSLVDEEGNFTPVYRCFHWITGGFKFRPNESNWDNDFGQDPSGELGDLIVDGEEDCNKADGSFTDDLFEDGFYMIEVNVETMKWTLTEVEHIGIVGTVVGDWNTDTEMTYNKETGAWEVTADLVAGAMKFRMNHKWDISWGGVNDDPKSYDNLTHDSGCNLDIDEDGTYFIQLYIVTEGNNKVVITKQ